MLDCVIHLIHYKNVRFFFLLSFKFILFIVYDMFSHSPLETGSQKNAVSKYMKSCVLLC